MTGIIAEVVYVPGNLVKVAINGRDLIGVILPDNNVGIIYRDRPSFMILKIEDYSVKPILTVEEATNGLSINEKYAFDAVLTVLGVKSPLRY